LGRNDGGTAEEYVNIAFQKVKLFLFDPLREEEAI